MINTDVSNSSTSSQSLIADFQAVFIGLSTSRTANYVAQKSEEQLLNSLSTNGQGYLDSETLERFANDQTAMISLDAHIKKAQAGQLSSLASAQLNEISQKNSRIYRGKKVKAVSIGKDFLPFDAIWFDKNRGYKNYEYRKSKVSGKIHELNFERNYMIVKPSILSRIFINDLKFFVVYVINPNTAEPAIDLVMM